MREAIKKPFGLVKKSHEWLRQLFEEDCLETGKEGKPSLRRVAFAYSVFVVSAVLFLQIPYPHILSDSTVGLVRELFICVAVVYGAPRLAESVTDAISKYRSVAGK